MVADWLRAEIAEGLQKLLALRLPGTPPEDAIRGTAEVWLEAIAHCGITWAEALDRRRVRQAFLALYRTCDRWPAPRFFLDQLGARDAPKALRQPPMTADERMRTRELLRDALRPLHSSKTFTMTGDRSGNQDQSKTQGKNSGGDLGVSEQRDGHRRHQ